MVRKSDIVREAVKAGDMKKALRIAKDFQINVTREQRSKMSRAYECMVHVNFYLQLGQDIQQNISDGIDIVTELFGGT